MPGRKQSPSSALEAPSRTGDKGGAVSPGNKVHGKKPARPGLERAPCWPGPRVPALPRICCVPLGDPLPSLGNDHGISGFSSLRGCCGEQGGEAQKVGLCHPQPLLPGGDSPVLSASKVVPVTPSLQIRAVRHTDHVATKW